MIDKNKILQPQKYLPITNDFKSEKCATIEVLKYWILCIIMLLCRTVIQLSIGILKITVFILLLMFVEMRI